MTMSFDQMVASRPELRPPMGRYAKDIVGPFYLECDDSGSGTQDVDLTLQQAWYHDAQARAVYAVGDSSTKLRAVLQIEAVKWLLLDQADADVSVKESILAGDPYVEIQVGNVTSAFSLTEAICEVVETSGTTATTTESGSFRGTAFKLPEPLRVNLENGQFRFKTLTAIGTAISGRLVVYGALTEIERAGDFAPGANCGQATPQLQNPNQIRDWQASSGLIR